MRWGPSIVKDGLVFLIDAADPNCFDGVSGCRDLSSQGNHCTAFGNLKVNSKFGSPGWNFTGYTGDYIETNNTITLGSAFSYEVMLTAPGYKSFSGAAFGYDGFIPFSAHTAKTPNGGTREKINLHMGFNDSLSIFLGSDYGVSTGNPNFSTSQGASGYGFMYIQTTMENGTGKIWFSPKESGFNRASTLIGYTQTGYYTGLWQTNPNRTGYLLVGRFGGIYNDGYPVSGAVNFVRVYNRALSESEVLQNYNAVKGRFNLQ